MGKPNVLRTQVDQLPPEYYRFVVLFTWTGLEDNVAVQRLTPYVGHQFPPEMEIDSESAQFYYLTGARTVLVVGYTKSGAGLQRFCSSVIRDTLINANVYHAVEGYEAAKPIPKTP
ncbi:MAG: hypothetical protein HY913_11155 [Desulfomonile tiedjei]|nr:hypothetical protein [Desulfomonile tiedjei]